MARFYERVVRPILFLQDPELAHRNVTFLLRVLGRCPSAFVRWLGRTDRNLTQRKVDLFGISFPNAVGLAAGMDKNACFWKAAAALGFGHVEIGTVTHRPQPGNPVPRLFRYPQHQALVNRMGFNNDGAEVVAGRLRAGAAHKNRIIPLGVNIGKSKVTSLDLAAEDYRASFRLLADYADYCTVNVSSPNTPELRRLQGHRFLPGLLGVLQEENRERTGLPEKHPIPLLVKIAPDLDFQEIDQVLEDVMDLGFDGVVATNTTIAREGPFARLNEAGGLSGAPLHARAVEVVAHIHRITSGGFPVIGVGGVRDADTARRMVDAGASLVQVYTGLIYRGPSLAHEIARALARD